MKYIVTGGAGFIGSHIVDRLLLEGHKVIVIDNLSTGLLENIDLNNENLTFINIDVSNYNELLPFYNFFKDVDGVFHLAAVARIQQAIQNPTKSHEINITGTFNILQMMRENKIKKIVFSSSSSVYGLKNNPPQVETMEVDCLNPYSLSKFVGENYVKTFCKLYEISGCCLRYFNVWGPREVLQGELAPIVGLFYRKILKDKSPLTIIGDGLQQRDFTSVFDVVDANILAMNHDKNLYGDVFNVGTGINYSILELADMVLDSLRIDRTYKEFVQKRPAESRATKANNEKAKRILGWEPKIILQKYINNHKEYYVKKWDI